jgi:hypothetical protein
MFHCLICSLLVVRYALVPAWTGQMGQRELRYDPQLERDTQPRDSIFSGVQRRHPRERGNTVFAITTFQHFGITRRRVASVEEPVKKLQLALVCIMQSKSCFSGTSVRARSLRTSPARQGRAVATLGARGTQSLATLSLWGAGAATPPQRPTRGILSGACGPKPPPRLTLQQPYGTAAVAVKK